MRRAALLGALLLAGCGSGAPAEHARPKPAAPVAVPAATGPGPGPFGAQLLRATALRARPGGRVIARLERRTEFGSAQVLAVARRGDRWLAVRTPVLSNGHVGWIRAGAARLLHEPWTLEIWPLVTQFTHDDDSASAL